LRILLAVEDPNFFSHHGVDLSAPGAGLTTITQALAKRLYFESFQPGLAKIKQSLLAFVLNQRMEKNAQLEFFINTAYFGEHDGAAVNGFAAAARAYFNKEFAAISREEYLALVAMLIAPNELSIATQPEKNAKRVRRIERLLSGECKPAGVRDVYYESCD
jgi:membrane carboxypeptidase/penicillin-binding protein